MLYLCTLLITNKYNDQYQEPYNSTNTSCDSNENIHISNLFTPNYWCIKEKYNDQRDWFIVRTKWSCWEGEDM